MRKILMLPISLLVTACVNDSASYYIDGSNHSLTLRREQEYFWKDEATLSLVAARFPECQRRHVLAPAPVADVEIEVFGAGDGVWTLRSGQAAWQVETQTCTLSQAAPKGELGARAGTFKIRDEKLVFEPAADATAAPASTTQ